MQKQCSKCLEKKPLGAFAKRLGAPDKLQSWCKACHRKANEARHKERYAAGQEFRRLVDYNRMFAEQGGVCAICRKPETAVKKGVAQPLSVDHDHETGKVRGLLCDSCNRGLGIFQDDRARIERAADYLARNQLPLAALRMPV